MARSHVSALAAAFGLAVVHLFAARLRFLDVIPRSRWLSLAGGVSVAYVFVHLLPELHASQEAIETALTALAFLERHAYLVALLGLGIFYALERATVRSRRRRREQGRPDRPAEAVFWVSVASYGVYNAVIGYLLVRRAEPGREGLVLFAVALALHFLVNDYGLRQHHRERYTATGRWLLSGAVLLGSILGMVVRLPEAAVAVPVAFLSGGIILNVLKEELPEERESRLVPFVVGATGYAALLVVT